VLVLLAKPPSAGAFVRVTYVWGWGLYASALVSAIGTVVALRLGGPAPLQAEALAQTPIKKPAVDRNKNLKLH